MSEILKINNECGHLIETGVMYDTIDMGAHLNDPNPDKNKTEYVCAFKLGPNRFHVMSIEGEFAHGYIILPDGSKSCGYVHIGFLRPRSSPPVSGPLRSLESFRFG